MLVGNHRARRGHALPGFCKELGLRRMDIIWMENEQIPSSYINVLSKRNGKRSGRSLLEVEDSSGPSMEVLIGELYASGIYDPLQQTILDARLGMNQTVRFWSGELSVIKDDSLQFYLDEGAYSPVPLHLPGEDPVSAVMDEPLRDMVGALMLDGLSESAAYAEAFTCAESSEDRESLAVQMAQRKPNHWYKVSDVVYYTFNDADSDEIGC